MRKITLIVGCVAALAAATAISASSASAAEWFVNGSALTGSTEISPTTKTVKDPVLTGAGETVECTGLTLDEAFIVATSSGSSQEGKLTGCQSTTVGCTIGSTTIVINSLTSSASSVSGTETKMVFKPTNPEGVFAKIKFNSGCPTPGTISVKGTQLTATEPKGTTELAEQELVLNSTGELKMGTNAATLTGKLLLHLSSGNKWSFH